MLVGRIHNMLVHLVGDNVNVVFFRKVGNQLKLVKGENLTARVRWIAEYKGFGILPERRFKLVGIEIEFERIKGHINRLRSR